jgi:DNA (cytosine-5)-methyltransferase 1
MRELALFAGAGGGILGGVLLGWQTVCAVEIDAFCARRLLQRQNEGHLPPFPVWDDVCTFDGRVWRGLVDVVSGGFPCTDISSVGKRKGIDGEHSGLWREMARIVSEVQPEFVLIENSPHLRTRGLVRVLKDLDCMGYNTARGVLGADACGAPHIRKRMWIVAHADNEGQRDESVYAQVACASQYERSARSTSERRQIANSDSAALRDQQRRGCREKRKGPPQLKKANWWPVDYVSGVDDGLADRLDRIRATGNGQVPSVARLAWHTLTPLLLDK